MTTRNSRFEYRWRNFGLFNLDKKFVKDDYTGGYCLSKSSGIGTFISLANDNNCSVGKNGKIMNEN